MILQLGDPQRLKGAALSQFQAARAAGVSLELCETKAATGADIHLPDADLIFDGLFGGRAGMGGGMGATFGGQAPGAESLRGRDSSASGAMAGKQDADLLGGLQQSNQGLQRKHVDRLKGMSKGGMGGVGAGAAF